MYIYLILSNQGHLRLGGGTNIDILHIGCSECSNGSILPAVKRTGLCQIVCQARSLGAYLLFACVSLDVISLLLVVINPFATNTYNRPVWTVDMETVGSAFVYFKSNSFSANNLWLSVLFHHGLFVPNRVPKFVRSPPWCSLKFYIPDSGH